MLTEELLATAKQAESAQNVAGLSPPNYSTGVQSEVLCSSLDGCIFVAGSCVEHFLYSLHTTEIHASCSIDECYMLMNIFVLHVLEILWLVIFLHY